MLFPTLLNWYISSNFDRNQRNTIFRRLLPFMSIMSPVMGITRMRRLLVNPCNPPYLGYLLGYCSSCQEQLVPNDALVWNLVKFMVLLVEGYHNAVQTWRGFFLLINVTILGTGCMLDYLDVLKR